MFREAFRRLGRTKQTKTERTEGSSKADQNRTSKDEVGAACAGGRDSGLQHLCFDPMVRPNDRLATPRLRIYRNAYLREIALLAAQNVPEAYTLLTETDLSNTVPTDVYARHTLADAAVRSWPVNAGCGAPLAPEHLRALNVFIPRQSAPGPHGGARFALPIYAMQLGQRACVTTPNDVESSRAPGDGSYPANAGTCACATRRRAGHDP